MISERLQILITPEQRRRLGAEARRRQTSVACLIREAIDARFGSVTQEERVRAAEEIRGARRGRFLSPAELDRLVDEERYSALETPRTSKRR